jgi:uncharacterized protein (TIGR00369 family)
MMQLSLPRSSKDIMDTIDTAADRWGTPQQRTVTWHDPLTAAEAGRTMTGRAYLAAIKDGDIPPPPIAALMGFDLVAIGDGEAWFAMTPDASVYNPLGMVHGGMVATLLDSALGCAVHTTLPAGTAHASIEIKVSYLRSISQTTGRITAHGWVTKPGRRVAFAEGDVRDPDGKVLATASSSIAVMAGE